MSTFQNSLLTLAFAGLTATAVAPAFAAGHLGTAADFGSPASANFAMRTVVVDGNTKWVNVTNGETVQFSVEGQSFTWHFDTFPDETSFDLAKIAPASIKAGSIRIYVAPNPLYRG